MEDLCAHLLDDACDEDEDADGHKDQGPYTHLHPIPVPESQLVKYGTIQVGISQPL